MIVIVAYTVQVGCETVTKNGQNCVYLPAIETYCTPSPCNNGGTCVVTDSGFKCSCRPQYAGELCETSKNLFLAYIVLIILSFNF